MSPQRLEGKVALITGAASGIGEAAARLFSEHGAFVVVADIQDDLGHKVAASIGAPNKASYVHCDVTDEDQVESAVKYTVERYGSLDILFSNAGVIDSSPYSSSILDLDLRGFNRTLGVNLRGVAATIKHAARAMMANRKMTTKGGGSIICTGSVAATIGGAGPAGYTASKHGLVGLVKAASSELTAFGIRVNSLSPFGVATGLVGKGFDSRFVEAVVSEMGNLKGVVLKPKDVAEAALFLASDESAYISGHNMMVDGGYSVVDAQKLGLLQSKICSKNTVFLLVKFSYAVMNYIRQSVANFIFKS